jgi:uncharacterized protein (DUF58 family)
MIPKDILRKVRQIQIRTRHMVSDLFAGSYHSVFKGQGMEFHEVRDYVPGDDIRAIDWNVTARMGHPFIKKYVEERELTVMLLVDVSGSLDFGSGAQFKKDLAAELAAVLSFAATQNNDRVGLLLFADEVEHFLPPRKGTRHVLRVIRDALYFKSRGRGTNLGAALTYLSRVTTRRSVVMVISDFLDDQFRTALTVAARRHDVIAVVVDDPREAEWVPAGVVEWEDAETGERCLVDTSDRGTRAALARHQTERRQTRDQQLRAAGVDIIRVTTSRPYAPELVKFFRQRERRRAS